MVKARSMVFGTIDTQQAQQAQQAQRKRGPFDPWLSSRSKLCEVTLL